MRNVLKTCDFLSILLLYKVYCIDKQKQNNKKKEKKKIPLIRIETKKKQEVEVEGLQFLLLPAASWVEPTLYSCDVLRNVYHFSIRFVVCIKFRIFSLSPGPVCTRIFTM